MARQLINGVLLAAVAFAPLGTPAHAQTPGVQDAPRSWRVAVWVKGGYQLPSGKFAQSSESDVPELVNFQSQFRVDPATLAGGAIEVRFPSESMAVRLGWERSGVADAVGRLGICNVLEGPICEPLLAPTQFQALMGEFRFLMRRSGDRLRPIFLAGAGIRDMDIDSPTCNQTGEALLICQTIVVLYQDPSPHGYLRLGLGLEVAPGPLLVNMVGSVGAGRYAGGSERTNGTWYNEVRFELSAGFVVY